MKKINLLLLFVGIIGLTAITSCNPDATETAKPTISFIAEGGSITADATDIGIDAPLLFKMSLDQSVDTKKKIKTLSVKSISNNNIVVDTLIDVNKDNTIVSLTFNAPSTFETEEKFTFTIEDNAGVMVTKTITITTEADGSVVLAGEISSYSAVLMEATASSNNLVDNFLNANTGTVHNKTYAEANSDLIDIIYYWGSNDAASFAAPNSVKVGGTGNNFALATGMTTKNETLFLDTDVTASEFDAMTDDTDFPTSLLNPVSEVLSLTNGEVVSFYTANGKYGFAKITNITTGSTGSISLDVKIQE